MTQQTKRLDRVAARIEPAIQKSHERKLNVQEDITAGAPGASTAPIPYPNESLAGEVASSLSLLRIMEGILDSGASSAGLNRDGCADLLVVMENVIFRLKPVLSLLNETDAHLIDEFRECRRAHIAAMGGAA